MALASRGGGSGVLDEVLVLLFVAPQARRKRATGMVMATVSSIGLGHAGFLPRRRSGAPSRHHPRTRPTRRVRG